MVNSMHIAMELHSLLNPLEIPANTEGREGFTHLAEIHGDVGTTSMRYLVRDHEMSKFTEKKNALLAIGEFLNKKYGEDTVSIHFEDVMHNMRDKILNFPFIIDNAVKAMEELDCLNKEECRRYGKTGRRSHVQQVLPCVPL